MNIVLLSVLAAVTAVAPSAPKPEIRNVRISSPKVSVARERSDSEAFVTGQVHVDMSFSKNVVKTPVLRLTCLCEVDGVLSVRSIFLDKPETYKGMREGERRSALRASGVAVNPKDAKAWCADPAKFTAYLPETTKASYASAIYGTGELTSGFFRLGRSTKMPRVILFRFELWQNGARIAQYESSHTGLGKYEIPADWYVLGKYPQKFRYPEAP